MNFFLIFKSNDASKCHYYRSENEENLPDAPIEQNEAEQLLEDISVNSTHSQVQLQSNELLPELGDVRYFVEFPNILNSGYPGEATIEQRSIANNILQSLYGERSDNVAISLVNIMPHKLYLDLLQLETQ